RSASRKLFPARLRPLKLASLKSNRSQHCGRDRTSVRSAPIKSVSSSNVASPRSAPANRDSLNFADFNNALLNFVLVRSQPMNAASVMSASEKSTPQKSPPGTQVLTNRHPASETRVNLPSIKAALSRLQLLQRVPVKSEL